MKPKNMFIYAFLTGILNFMVTMITWSTHGFIVNTSIPLTFVTFMGYAAFFLFGATPKAAAQGYASMILGIISAASMMALSTVISGAGPTVAVAVAIGIVVFFMCYIEKIPFANKVAGAFFGATIFFAFFAAGAFPTFPPSLIDYIKVGITEMYYVIIGLFAGWVTLQIYIFASKLGGEQPSGVT